MKKRNIVFDQISFFKRRQEEGEPVASFVNDVYTMAKHCNLGDMHDEMVRDIYGYQAFSIKDYWNDYSWMVISLWKRL